MTNRAHSRITKEQVGMVDLVAGIHRADPRRVELEAGPGHEAFCADAGEAGLAPSSASHRPGRRRKDPAALSKRPLIADRALTGRASTLA